MKRQIDNPKTPGQTILKLEDKHALGTAAQFLSDAVTGGMDLSIMEPFKANLKLLDDANEGVTDNVQGFWVGLVCTNLLSVRKWQAWLDVVWPWSLSYAPRPIERSS